MNRLSLFGWVLIGVLLAVPLHAQLPDTLSLDVLLQQALQTSLARQTAELEQQRAQFRYRLYQADLRPQLRATANFPNYVKTFGEIVQPDGTIRFQPLTNNNSSVGLTYEQALPLTGGTFFAETSLQRFDDFETDFSLYNGLPFRVGISQPIFTFNALKWQKKIEPLRLQVARQQYSVAAETIREEVTGLYFDLLLAYRDLQMAEANETANQRLYGIAEERYTLGKISRRDLVQLEIELISARREQASARQRVAQLSAAVYTYLGAADTGERLVPRVPPIHTTAPPAEAMLLEHALRNRPEATDQQVQLLAAERDIDRARRTDGPALALEASYGRVRSAMRLEDVYADPLPEQIVRLRLSLPLLDGGRRRTQVALATAESEYAQQAVAQQKLDFRNDIVQLARQFEQLQSEVSAAAEILDLTRERLRISTESYVLGAISLTELTLAQRENDEANRSFTGTLRQYYLAYAQLRKLTLYDVVTQRDIVY